MLDSPRLKVAFYKNEAGKEPVRDWLLSLNPLDRKAIGQDLKTAQFGWPLGMPLIRKVEPGIWEVRSHISSGIARVLFTIEDNLMILLHGFIKKTTKIRGDDMALARKRLTQLRGEK